MKKIIFICLLTGCFEIMSAQQTEIKGRVTDGQTSKALPGTTISIKGTTISVTTNNEGYYIFSDISAGKIVLQLSHVGYETIEKPVIVKSGITLVADIDLFPVYKTGDDIVLTKDDVDMGALNTEVVSVTGFTVYRYTSAAGTFVRVHVQLTSSVDDTTKSLDLYGGAIIRGAL